MARPVTGEVVVLPFPFSDLTGRKRRPALVIATLPGDDLILCQITSQAKTDAYAVALGPDDFAAGKLSRASNIRPNKLFTADESLIAYTVGKLERAKFNAVVDKIFTVIRKL